MKLFQEENEVLEKLLSEFYEAIKDFTESADTIFSEKGRLYDKDSPVWERIEFPRGFKSEIKKKANRVGQLIVAYGFQTGQVKWDEVLEELADIMNYARMCGAIIMMLRRKEEL